MVAKQSYPRFLCYINLGRVVFTVFCPRFLSEGPCILSDRLDCALAEGSSQCLVEHAVVVDGPLPRLLCTVVAPINKLNKSALSSPIG